MSLTWNEFQELCWRLSFKMGEIKPDCADELDGLIRVDDLLRVILEGKAEPFDPKRAADWIRQRMLDFAEIQHRDNLSGGPKGKSPFGSPGRLRSLGRLRPPHPDLDVSSVHGVTGILGSLFVGFCFSDGALVVVALLTLAFVELSLQVENLGLGIFSLSFKFTNCNKKVEAVLLLLNKFLG